MGVSSCATPPNVPVCIELEERRGWCTYTTEDREFFVDDVQLYDEMNWEQLDRQSVRVPARSWAKIKAYILKMCKKSGGCSNVTGFKRRSARVEAQLRGEG